MGGWQVGLLGGWLAFIVIIMDSFQLKAIQLIELFYMILNLPYFGKKLGFLIYENFTFLEGTSPRSRKFL